MLNQLLTVDHAVAVRLWEQVQFFAVVALCAGILSLVYRRTASHEDDNAEFAATIFVLTIAIGLLVSIIKQAPAISFGLFGAMSIVRFRTQIKQPQRMIFVFMSAAIGVCCGAGEFLTTFVGTLVLSGLSWAAFSRTANLPFAGTGVGSENNTTMEAAPPVGLPQGMLAAVSFTQASPPASQWSIDFLPVPVDSARRIRVLMVIDETTGEALASVADTSFSSARVADELDSLFAVYGKPTHLTSDSWPEFSGRIIKDWRKSHGMDWEIVDLTDPAQPPGEIVSYGRQLHNELLVPGPTDLNTIRDLAESFRTLHNANLERVEVARLTAAAKSAVRPKIRPAMLNAAE
jgi:hypothetical protein